MPIDALLFDADGVIIFPWRFAQFLEREHGITPAQTRGFFTGVFVDCMVGQADLRAELPPFLAQWGWRGTADEFMAHWFRTEDAADPQMLNAIVELRGQGTPCYLATNQEAYRLAYMRKQMRFETHFDGIFASCEVGHMKHDAAYFAQVTQKLGLQPAHILFWDDSLGNVDTARRFGWQAEHFIDYSAFQSTIANYMPTL
ncbi:MAG: HAD-IA family hydrolase [Caldilineaceae bacterium]